MLFKTKFLYLENVDSTIEYAKSYIASNYPLNNNVVIIADCQSCGVGKIGRKWYSPKGNLYLTAIFKNFDNYYSWCEFKDINIFNLLIAVSLIELTGKLINNRELCYCKWPNDIIINESKISGILLEKIHPKYGNLLLASVGFNINVAPKVNNTYKTISLNDINKVYIKPTDFGNSLISTIYNNIKNLTKNEVISQWMNYAYKLEQKVTVKVGNVEKSGIFKGINENGLLLLEGDNKRIEALSVGEVY